MGKSNAAATIWVNGVWFAYDGNQILHDISF